MPAILTDFGLAKSSTTGSRYTRTGQALGTPAYMAPEQARGETVLTPAADVWSLGCVLYEVLAGRRPFDGETPAELIAGLLVREPVRLRTVRPDVPASLEAVVRVCLSKYAGARYASARELALDLARVLRGERVAARPVTGRASRVVALLTAAALAGGGVLAWRARAPAPDGPLAGPPTSPPHVVRAEKLAAQALAIRWTGVGEAARGLREALALLPDRHAWRVELGLLEWAGGRDAAACDAWDAVPDGDAHAHRARWLAGLCFEARNVLARDRRFSRETEARFAAAAAGDQSREARAARAGLQLLRGERAAAAAALTGLEGWDVDLLATLIMSDARAHGEPWDTAALETWYTRILADGPPLPWIWLNRAGARFERGDLEGAEADLVANLKAWPDDPKALASRGGIRRIRGDLAGADADLSAAIRSDPAEPDPYVTRADVRRQLGDLAGARADLDAAIARAPRDAEALGNRASNRLETGDPEGALLDADAAVARAPRDARLRLVRGTIRVALRDHVGGEADYAAAVQADPESLDAHAKLGLLREGLGNWEGARAAFGAFLERCPTGPRADAVREHVARCEAALGRR